MTKISDEILDAVKEEIDNSGNKQISIEEIADRFNVDKHALQREFRHKFGIPMGRLHTIRQCCHLHNELITHGKSKTLYTYSVEMGYDKDSGLGNFVERNYKGRSFNWIRDNAAKVKKEFCESNCEYKCEHNCGEK